MRRITALLQPLAVLFLALPAAPVLAQYPPPARPLPVPVEPLMYVRFAGPVGARVTFYRGRAVGETHTVPFTAGFRPGYVYRMQMSNLPGQREDFSLFPTLEVRAV